MALSKRIRPLLIIGAVILGLVAFGFLGLNFYRAFDSLAKVRAFAERLGIFAPLGLIVIQAAQIILAPVPGTIISIASGYLFGVVKGILWTTVGVIIGTSLVLLLSRFVGRRLVVRFVKKETLDKWDGRFQKWGLTVIFLLYLLPNPLGDIVSYLAGLTVWPLPALILIATIGRLPGVVLSSYIGHHASALAVKELIFFIVGWIVLAVIYYFLRNKIEKLFFQKNRLDFIR